MGEIERRKRERENAPTTNRLKGGRYKQAAFLPTYSKLLSSSETFFAANVKSFKSLHFLGFYFALTSIKRNGMDYTTFRLLQTKTCAMLHHTSSTSV